MRKYVPKRPHSGFTLIELLIASALLSMIILVGSMSYGLFANNWSKELGQYKASVAFTRDLESLRKVLVSSFPLLIGGDNGKNAVYWQGNQDSLQAASLNGFFIDAPVIYRLEVQQNEKGINQLVYLEVASNKVLLDKIDQPIVFTYRRVIIDHLTSLNLQYWGWQNIGEKNTQLSNTGNATRKWLPNYVSNQTKLFPERVKLTIRYQNTRSETKNVTIQAQFFTTTEVGLNDQ